MLARCTREVGVGEGKRGLLQEHRRPMALQGFSAMGGGRVVQQRGMLHCLHRVVACSARRAESIHTQCLARFPRVLGLAFSCSGGWQWALSVRGAAAQAVGGWDGAGEQGQAGIHVHNHLHHSTQPLFNHARLFDFVSIVTRPPADVQQEAGCLVWAQGHAQGHHRHRLHRQEPRGPGERNCGAVEQ